MRRLVPASCLVALLAAACAAPAPPPSTAPPAPPGLRPAVQAPPPVPDTERWTGLVLERVTEALAASLNLPRVEGLYVRQVEPGSPAAQAGIRPEDVVLLAGGTYLDAPETLPRVLAGAPAGSAVELAVRRGGDLVPVRLTAATSPPGRLMVVIQPPVRGLSHIAADGAALYGYGPVPGREDPGIVPLQLPGGPLPTIAPRAVANPGAERVIAADGERVYLGWAGSEIYLDFYEIQSGRVGRVPVRGAESLANRCRPQGLTRVGAELWMACQRPEGPALVRVDLGSGSARVEPLPATYSTGLAFDGEAVWWLCCQAGGQIAVSRTELASGAAKVFPLRERAVSVAADRRAVYLLGPSGIFQHKPWR
jgi:membrane-associated protease RseP (regulator of RpoE activity)